MKFHIVTFGCAANEADSERIEAYYLARGFTKALDIKQADNVIINTCMVRQSAEDRIYGLVHNLKEQKNTGRKLKIIVTGCMVGMAVREKTGKMLRELGKKMPAVDEFLPIEEVGFDDMPIRGDGKKALVPISNGCNNFCTFCVVPFTRGREISRPFDEIIDECRHLAGAGYSQILLIGQNVNSYGADLLVGEENIQVLRDIPNKKYFRKIKIQNPKFKESYVISKIQKNIKPTYVKHLGRYRIPTLFPELLNEISKIKGIKKIDFISSNPWDFSDDLIKTISENSKITRNLHIAVQSGDDGILKKMNRWYTRTEFLTLVNKLRRNIPGVKISTDIIVGFCGETERQFQNTVSLCKKAGFYKAYVSMYSDRPMTAAHKVYEDNVPYELKKKRWQILEDLINKPNLKRKIKRH